MRAVWGAMAPASPPMQGATCGALHLALGASGLGKIVMAISCAGETQIPADGTGGRLSHRCSCRSVGAVPSCAARHPRAPGAAGPLALHGRDWLTQWRRARGGCKQTAATAVLQHAAVLEIGATS